VSTPPAVIVLDTEADRRARPEGEVQSLRLWTARYVRRREQGKLKPRDLSAHGHTGAGLAQAVNGWLQSGNSTWLFAHNLSYDLPVSGLVGHLCALGWKVSACTSLLSYVWLVLKRGRQRITISDLHHFLPTTLAQIGGLLGLPKMPMPAKDAGDGEWFAYCARDTDVAMTAILALMDHWDEKELGKWAMTGAASGFHAMRHTYTGIRPTLFDEPGGTAFDRRAIYGGRRSVWHHGELPPGRYAELDLEAAYATAAASWPLPHKRGAWFASLDVSDRRVWRPEICVIAECDIETDVPRFPVRTGGRVRYPVGRFTTVLAGPDIAWARETGCLKAIGRGQFHLLGRSMQPFFRRVLEWGTPGKSPIPPVAAMMWKQFGRGVVGKFAQHGYETRDTGMLTDEPWHYERVITGDGGEQRWRVHYGGTIKEAWQEGDGRYAYPAVTAVVESLVRVAVGKAAEMLGPGVTVTCDTDGMWANMGALEAGDTTGLGFSLSDIAREARIDLAKDVINRAIAPFRLREKNSVSVMTVTGPQNYTAGAMSRHAGRASGMRPTGDGSWAGDTFPGLAWQMAHGGPERYHMRKTQWRPPICLTDGWVTADGTVLPLEAVTGGDGQAVILPWSESRHTARGTTLGPHQHPALAGLWDPATDTEVNTNGKQAIWDRPQRAAAADRAARRHEAGLAVTPPGLPPVRRQPRVHQTGVPSRSPTPERVERGGARSAGSENETIT